MTQDRWPIHAEYAPLPADDLLKEQGYLVARGVRALALIGACATSEALRVRQRLLALASPGALPFVVVTDEQVALYGYAGNAWAVDLLVWSRSAPRVQQDRILGLLLGYSADAIYRYEELARTIGTSNGLPSTEEHMGIVDEAAPAQCPQCGEFGHSVVSEPVRRSAARGGAPSPKDGAPHEVRRLCAACGYQWVESSVD